ncbi:ATP-binding protein, partial [Nonomuraea sp. NPDC055795]
TASATGTLMKNAHRQLSRSVSSPPRIVQEALTNVLKHAGAQRATVLIERQEEGLVVEITDDGRNARERPYGHGLKGLRERVRIFGGEFEAGVRPVRGFRVMARLPL